MKLLVLHGGDRKAHFDMLADYDLIITSYPLLPRDQTVLLGQEFQHSHPNLWVTVGSGSAPSV